MMRMDRVSRETQNNGLRSPPLNAQKREIIRPLLPKYYCASSKTDIANHAAGNLSLRGTSFI